MRTTGLLQGGDQRRHRLDRPVLGQKKRNDPPGWYVNQVAPDTIGLPCRSDRRQGRCDADAGSNPHE
jgi:hypothetical protein